MALTTEEGIELQTLLNEEPMFADREQRLNQKGYIGTATQRRMEAFSNMLSKDGKEIPELEGGLTAEEALEVLRKRKAEREEALAKDAPQAPAVASLAVEEPSRVSTEQRENAITQLENTIEARFKEENPIRGMFSSGPEVPAVLKQMLLQNETIPDMSDPANRLFLFNAALSGDPVIKENMMNLNYDALPFPGKKIDVYDKDGNLNPEMEKRLVDGMLNGKIERYIDQVREQNPQMYDTMQARWQNSVAPHETAIETRKESARALSAAIGERAETVDDLLDKVEAKLETGADGRRNMVDMISINIPDNIRNALRNGNVVSYQDAKGDQQTIDFRKTDAKELAAEMKELATLVKADRAANVDEVQMQNVATNLANLNKQIER